MAENKRSFVLYIDYIHTVQQLPVDKAGELFMTILEYVNDLDPQPQDLLVRVTFEPIKQQLKRDLKKWEGIKGRRSEAGKKSAEVRQQKATNSTSVDFVEQTPTNSTVTEDVNVTVNVIDTVTVINNTSTDVDDGKVDNEKELKQAYSFLSKNFITVHDFIKEHKPQFPEPYFDLWNLFAKETGMPVLRKLTSDRKKTLLRRLREPEFNMIEILGKARDSNLIRNGKWFSFDWFTGSEKNYLKILEGNYDNNRVQSLVSGATKNKGEDAIYKELGLTA